MANVPPSIAKGVSSPQPARILAFYLPQFHPIPENDLWWGRGFTEWRNVAGARSLFRNHHQPHLPADLGFYDLRLVEVQEAQAAMAAKYLIEGFCVWHYWSGGRQLLERPVDQVLESRDTIFPFCLAWANEPWSRRWLGEEKNVLWEQIYSEQDDEDHARWLVRAFADHRYITVNGGPLFLIYAPAALPSPERTADTIRRVATREGLGSPFLVGIDARKPGADFRKVGFDGTLHFEPQLSYLPGALNDGWSASRLTRNMRLGVPSARTKVYLDTEARHLFDMRRPSTWTHRSVMVGWDNTPRRGVDGVVLAHPSPSNFQRALEVAITDTEAKHQGDARLVFINAWNEWAEGNHLEPDQSFGHAFLDATKAAVATASEITPIGRASSGDN
jgi:lipopolysaccharide biosynthesis protein